jgi:putative transcriptional regulator
MKSERTIRVERRGGKYVEVLPDGTTRPLARKTDWTAFDALTDEEIHKAALADPDAQPLTEAQLARMRRVSPVKRLRWKLGLSQAEFAERFQIPVGTLRDWEQHRSAPDQAAKAYLKVIAKDADFVRRALAAA